MLSTNARTRLVVALTDATVGQEVADAIDAGANAAAPTPAAHVAPVAAPNATDLASAETLANANKTAINAIIASLIASGAMAAS